MRSMPSRHRSSSIATSCSRQSSKVGSSTKPMTAWSHSVSFPSAFSPGRFRVPAGREGPYVGAADYAGAKIGMSDAAITEATLGALGATAVALLLRDRGRRRCRRDGSTGRRRPVRWPWRDALRHRERRALAATDLVIMNAERFAALTPEQQTWLREAAGDSIDEMIARAQTLDRETLGNACRNGAQFVNASTSDMAGLRAAVEPVYSSLRENESTSRAIDAIEALRSSDGLSLACPATAGASGAPAASATDLVATPVDGTWTACFTEEDVLAAGGDPDEARINAGVRRCLSKRAPSVSPARARQMPGRARTRSRATS